MLRNTDAAAREFYIVFFLEGSITAGMSVKTYLFNLVFRGVSMPGMGGQYAPEYPSKSSYFLVIGPLSVGFWMVNPLFDPFVVPIDSGITRIFGYRVAYSSPLHVSIRRTRQRLREHVDFLWLLCRIFFMDGVRTGIQCLRPDIKGHLFAVCK